MIKEEPGVKLFRRKSTQKIISALSEPKSFTEIRQETQLSPTTVAQILKEMKKMGWVEKVFKSTGILVSDKLGKDPLVYRLTGEITREMKEISGVIRDLETLKALLLEEYLDYLKREGYAEITIEQRMQVVKEFLKEYNLTWEDAKRFIEKWENRSTKEHKWLAINRFLKWFIKRDIKKYAKKMTTPLQIGH